MILKGAILNSFTHRLQAPPANPTRHSRGNTYNYNRSTNTQTRGAKERFNQRNTGSTSQHARSRADTNSQTSAHTDTSTHHSHSCSTWCEGIA